MTQVSDEEADEQRRGDAMALAQFLYDIFQEKKLDEAKDASL